MTSLKLDPITWDLTLDANNNLAIVSGDDAVSQDCASAVQLYQGELWYDTTQGVNWRRILNKLPPSTVLKSLITSQMLQVVGVIKAQVFFTSFVKRALGGQLQSTTSSGTTASNFTVG